MSEKTVLHSKAANSHDRTIPQPALINKAPRFRCPAADSASTSSSGTASSSGSGSGSDDSEIAANSDLQLLYEDDDPKFECAL